MKIKLLFILTIFAVTGCAEIQMPTAHYALSHPLSTKTMVSRGTSKEEVIEKWGHPFDIREIGYDDMGIKKEAWTYEAWFPGSPLDYRHFSRRKRIYFTGDYVTEFEDIDGKDEKEQ